MGVRMEGRGGEGRDGVVFCIVGCGGEETEGSRRDIAVGDSDGLTIGRWGVVLEGNEWGF